MVYQVVPFEQNIYLDKGIYDRKESGFIDLMGLERVKIEDKWDNKIYEYGKVSNERGQDRYSITPRYRDNRRRNKSAGFAYYRGSAALETGRGYAHNFFSAVQATQKILKDELFRKEFGNVMVDTNEHTKTIADKLRPREEVLASIDNMDGNTLLLYTCLYATYFIIVNFTEETPEETPESKIMKDFLNRLNDRQGLIAKANIEEGLVRYLGMLYRPYEYTYEGDVLVTKNLNSQSPHRFSTLITTDMKKFGNSHISGISDKFQRYIFKLSEELYQLVGYDNDMLSYKKDMHESVDYVNLKEFFISPFLESSKAYQECAVATLDYISERGEGIESKLNNLTETITNNFYSLNEKLGLLEYEANEFIMQQVTNYSINLLKYIKNLKEDIDIGRFKIRNSNSQTVGGYEEEQEYDTTSQMLQSGFIPFGYTLEGEQVASGANLYEYLNSLAYHGVKNMNKHYKKDFISSIFMEEIREFPELAEVRRDIYSKKIKISEIEILNNSIREILLTCSTLSEMGVESGNGEVNLIDSNLDSRLNEQIKTFKDYREQQKAELDNGKPNYFYYSDKILNDLVDKKERLYENDNNIVKYNVRVKPRGVDIQITLDLELMECYEELVDIVYRETEGSVDNKILKLKSNGLYDKDVVRLLKESANNIFSYIVEIYENKYQSLPQVAEVYSGMYNIINSIKNSGDIKSEVKIFDTKDLSNNLNRDMITLIMDRLSSCICKIENCRVEGKLTKEYVDINVPNTEAVIAEYIEPTKMTIDINVPYIEYYNILNNNKLENRIASIKNIRSIHDKGAIQAW